MKLVRFAAAIAAPVLSICTLQAQPFAPSEPAGQLVREVVYNELHDHQRHGYWSYWIERHSGGETRLDEQVETADGPIAYPFKSNGHPLGAEAEQVEQRRLRHLLNSPAEQVRHRQEYSEDEARIGRIVALLPDAFLYEPVGDENGCRHLRFRPNPAYPAHSIEARIFHAMTGDLWIDIRSKRMARLDGRLEENVDFGYGILGRLYKGGWFRLERTQVSETDWKTQRLEVHMSGRAMLFKTIARETSETRWGFAPVPAGMTLTQGVHLMENRPTVGELVPHAAFGFR